MSIPGKQWIQSGLGSMKPLGKRTRCQLTDSTFTMKVAIERRATTSVALTALIR